MERPGQCAEGHAAALLFGVGSLKVENIRSRIDDLGVLFELAAAENDAETLAEARRELAALRKDISDLEVRTLLSGPYDEREALISINAQAGGVDAADWTQMLQRMYLRWAERHGYPTEIYETSYAEEAGIKSTTFVVKAPYAYGMLRGEHGTHRLVRISPFDNQSRRQTSFAGVDVVPVVEQATTRRLTKTADRRVPPFRARRPGVNTTDSAVRITHLPTGIVVSRQNERSQLQNRATAVDPQAKLLDANARRRRPSPRRAPRWSAGVGNPDAQLRAPPLPERQRHPHRGGDREHQRCPRRRDRRVHQRWDPLAAEPGEGRAEESGITVPPVHEQSRGGFAETPAAARKVVYM